MYDSLTDYMDAARSGQDLRSDRALALKMDVQQTIVTRWRTGKSYPSDAEMRRLSQLAGADEEQALLLLNIWRAGDEPTRDTYRRLLRRFGAGSGIAIAVAASLALGPSPAEASPNSLVSLIVAAANVYYGKFRRFSRRVAGAASFLARSAGRLIALPGAALSDTPTASIAS
jgi:hypothetical protein